MLTEEDVRRIKAIKEDLKNVSDPDVKRDVIAIVEMAELYLLKSKETP